jgi:hypothetical protein
MTRVLPLLLVAACATAPTTRPTVAERRAAAARRARAMEEYDRKAYAECAADFDAAAKSPAHRGGTDAYGAACCLALAGRKDEAFARLGNAIDRGFLDAMTFARDTDLAALREDPRWAATMARLEEARTRKMAGENPELRQLYEADQAARQKRYEDIDWAVVSKQDEAHRARVAEIVAAGGAKVSGDWYHAAMVYQHGEGVEDIRKAREYALKAVELDADNGGARWLAAASLDRELMYQGKAQKYGTQFKKVDGRWILWRVDSSVSDDERDEWQVPPLASAQKQAEALNLQAQAK